MRVTEDPALHRPCALRTRQMEPLNSLDFCPGNLMDAFITACWISEPRHDLTLSLCPLFMQTAERDSVVPLFIQFSTCVLIPASIPLSLSLLINFLASYNVLLIRATETQMELMLQMIKVRDSVQAFSVAQQVSQSTPRTQSGSRVLTGIMQGYFRAHHPVRRMTRVQLQRAQKTH